MLKFDLPADWDANWARWMLDFFGHKLPSAQEYSDQLIAEGLAQDHDKDILEGRLHVAALRYFEGRAKDFWIKEQGKPKSKSKSPFAAEKELKQLLKTLGRGHPPQRKDHWYIREMDRIWRALGHRSTTAYKRKTKSSRGAEKETRFMQFCLSWMRIFDPERKHLPKRNTFVRALKYPN